MVFKENKSMTYEHHIHYGHLWFWNKWRFEKFYKERTENGATCHEVVEMWNRYITKPENAVYIVTKTKT